MLKKFTLLLTGALFLFVASCGTILKPNQKGKSHSGNIDATILILDGVGLLFFIIPGAIALTVDYMNGTLFLPRGKI